MIFDNYFVSQGVYKEYLCMLKKYYVEVIQIIYE